MAKDYDLLAQQIVEKVGGASNVRHVTHCMTRCRFELKNKELADVDTVTAIPGVLKVVEAGGQFQVVIGTDVTEVYDRVVAMVGEGAAAGSVEDAATEAADLAEAEAEQATKKFDPLGAVTKAMGAIFMPLMGAMIACGLISATAILLNAVGLLPADGPTYEFMRGIGMCVTYFLPILIGISSAKYFGLDQWIGGAIGAAMMYPTINNPELAGVTKNVFGVIPVAYQGYEQTVFPTMVAVLMAAYVYKLLDKVIPNRAKPYLVPTGTMLITLPVALALIGPVLNWLSLLVADLANTLIGISPILVGLVIGAAWGTVIIPLGLHGAIAMGLYNNLFTQGFDYTLGLLCVFTPNIGIMLASMLRTKDEAKKEFLLQSTITNIMGVGEPGLYGYIMTFKEAMATSAIASGLGCAVAAAFKTAFYTIGTSGILSFPSYMNPDGSMNSLLGWVFGNLVALVAGFAITWFWHFDKDETPFAA